MKKYNKSGLKIKGTLDLVSKDRIKKVNYLNFSIVVLLVLPVMIIPFICRTNIMLLISLIFLLISPFYAKYYRVGSNCSLSLNEEGLKVYFKNKLYLIDWDDITHVDITYLQGERTAFELCIDLNKTCVNLDSPIFIKVDKYKFQKLKGVMDMMILSFKEYDVRYSLNTAKGLLW